MPKESSIFRMDWRSLGYEREYKDGQIRWVPSIVKKNSKDKDSSS